MHLFTNFVYVSTILFHEKVSIHTNRSIHTISSLHTVNIRYPYPVYTHGIQYVSSIQTIPSLHTVYTDILYIQDVVLASGDNYKECTHCEVLDKFKSPTPQQCVTRPERVNRVYILSTVFIYCLNSNYISFSGCCNRKMISVN